MQTFVKIFCGRFLSEIEDDINTFAKDRSLTIKSCSITKGMSDIVVLVIFEKPKNIIRCKDCLHWNSEYSFCRLHGLNSFGSSLFGEEDFCSNGERWDENE